MARRMNSLKSLAMNCGPRSLMTRGRALGNFRCVPLGPPCRRWCRPSHRGSPTKWVPLPCRPSASLAQTLAKALQYAGVLGQSIKLLDAPFPPCPSTEWCQSSMRSGATPLSSKYKKAAVESLPPEKATRMKSYSAKSGTL